MCSKIKGKLVIVSAPSGAGKTTIVRALLEYFPNLKFSVSATSRPKRGEERDEIDYYFLSEKEFKKKIEKQEFVEWEEVYPGQYYGTLKQEVDKKHEEGFTVIFDVDVVGGLNIKKQYDKQALSVFIMPPNEAALEERLRGRQTESEEKIQLRLNKASKELQRANEFDVILLNDNLEVAIQKANKIIGDFLAE